MCLSMIYEVKARKLEHRVIQKNSPTLAVLSNIDSPLNRKCFRLPRYFDNPITYNSNLCN
ncbi:MAG: hypothetical protein RIR39_1487 [Pseudomonadota bacterium]